MSRRDFYHETVKQALIQEGWTITHDPYIFETEPQLSTDLAAERLIGAERNRQKIAVEIKSFRADSQVAELEKAIGQYGLYRRFLRLQEPERLLYLAVPQYAYTGIFAQQVGQVAIEEFELHLIIFETEEETLQWKTR